MPTTRQLYAADLLYVGPTGALPGTGALSSASVYGNILSATSGNNLISELFRVQKVDDNWSRRLTNVNQLGNLAAIDRVTIEPPSANISFSYLLSNLVNEALLGFTVSKAGSPSLVSCISGMLNGSTDTKNYFIKTVAEGNDANDFNPATYNVISFGNGFVSNYTVQAQVGGFPTVDITIDALNALAQNVTQSAGAITPAIFQSSGTQITGWGYVLPTGTQNFNGLGINSANQAISVIRPGDINLSLGLGAGQGFVSESDMKVQSFNLTFNLNREDLLKLGSKYAFAKVPRFPVDATLTVEALVGDFQTGSLVEIVNNNDSFNPSISLNAPGSNTVLAYYKLGNAKLSNNDFSQSVGSTAKTVRMTFQTQIGGPTDSVNGVYMSGQTI